MTMEAANIAAGLTNTPSPHGNVGHSRTMLQGDDQSRQAQNTNKKPREVSRGLHQFNLHCQSESDRRMLAANHADHAQSRQGRKRGPAAFGSGTPGTDVFTPLRDIVLLKIPESPGAESRIAGSN